MPREVPVPTVHLIPRIDSLLIELLQPLPREDWMKPTPAPAWRVKDIVAHLLDGNIRKEIYKLCPDTSFRALPHHFRNVRADNGDSMAIIVTGEGGGIWHLVYHLHGWELRAENPSDPVTEIHLNGKVLWRLFSKQISREEMKACMTVRGHHHLADHFLSLGAVMV